MYNVARVFLLAISIVLLAACASQTPKPSAPTTTSKPSARPPAESPARPLVGMVIAVIDGHTLTVQDESEKSYRVTLIGIQAPKLAQPYGEASRRYLAHQVLGETVTVRWSQRGKFGLSGLVLHKERDVNFEQLRAGLAWHDRSPDNEQEQALHARYAQGEKEARLGRFGLWKDAAPIPPWEFRMAK